MKKINIRRLYYHFRHKYMTLNNAVATAAILVAASWVWGSLGVMQRNYDLQREVDFKKRQLQLADLETSSLELEQRYYKTREYQELAVRQGLGLVLPGEKVLILPNNSPAALVADQPVQVRSAVDSQPTSNFQQWVNFLFGTNSKNLPD